MRESGLTESCKQVKNLQKRKEKHSQKVIDVISAQNDGKVAAQFVLVLVPKLHYLKNVLKVVQFYHYYYYLQ
jgi:hypothetical protein